MFGRGFLRFNFFQASEGALSQQIDYYILSYYMQPLKYKTLDILNVYNVLMNTILRCSVTYIYFSLCMSKYCSHICNWVFSESHSVHFIFPYYLKIVNADIQLLQLFIIRFIVIQFYIQNTHLLLFTSDNLNVTNDGTKKTTL